MKTKMLFISLAVVLVLSIGLIGCDGNGEEPVVIPPQPTEVVIGMSKSETGPLADIHWAAAYPIVGVFEQKIDAAGGILLKEYGATFKVPVNTITYDDASDVGTMLENTAKLITVDKVDFLWGATGTAMITAQAYAANTYKTVLMTMEGGATHLKDEGKLDQWPYVFVTLSFSDWNQLPVLADLLAANTSCESAYIAYIDDEHGLEYKETAETEFARVGIDVLGTFPMAADFTAFDSVIAAANATGADLFCGFTYPFHVMPLTGTSMAMGYNPDAMIFGPGANFGFYALSYTAVTLGDLVEGVMCFAVANDETSGEFEALFDDLEAFMDIFGAGLPEPLPGYYFLDWWGQPLYWAMTEMWQQAVEEVGYVSQTQLKSVLGSKDADDPFDTILGPTWYTMFGTGGGILAHECHPGQIGQWQSGICEIIGGNQTTADIIYPKP